MEERKVMVAGGNLLQAHTWKGMLETSGLRVELRGEALLGGVESCRLICKPLNFGPGISAGAGSIAAGQSQCR